MTLKKSQLLTFSDDESLSSLVRTILAPFGWSCPREEALGPVLDRLARSSTAAILIDGRTAHAPETVEAIRGLSPPLNGTPILIIGRAQTSGAGGVLPYPLEEGRFLDLLSHWTGPLDNHGLREEPWNARYRMIRLLGLEAADGMLERLRDTLAEALTSDTENLSAHRLAGIAGMYGFNELGEAWSRVDRGEDSALAAAIIASRETVAEIDRLLR
jgi:hypothetical protein